MLAKLLVFCDFLESRLHTSSLPLLRRIFSDFYAGNEHTLLDFMRLGASVVFVMPVELTRAIHRQEAARLLDQQKDQTTGTTQQQGGMETQSQSQQLTPCVFRYLSARVATKNILWLRDMFDEFRRGEDNLVRAFVCRGNEPISVIPVDIQALCMAPLPPPPLMVQNGTDPRPEPPPQSPESSSPSIQSPQRKRPRESDQNQHQDVSGYGDMGDNRTRKQTRATENESELVLKPPTSPSPSAEEMRKSIISTLKRLEAKEPWKQALNPESLPVPFSRVRYPKLAAALLEFWEIHARAVWERKFWAPLSRPRTHELHNQRKCRQSRAQSFFEKKVIIPVHTELGAEFFVEMDKRDTPHGGWYYLDRSVDLFTLAQRYSLSTCLQYMESEAFKRFPVVPGASHNYFSRVNGQSLSMWSLSPALQPLLHEIVALKPKANGDEF